MRRHTWHLKPDLESKPVDEEEEEEATIYGILMIWKASLSSEDDTAGSAWCRSVAGNALQLRIKPHKVAKNRFGALHGCEVMSDVLVISDFLQRLPAEQRHLRSEKISLFGGWGTGSVERCAFIQPCCGMSPACGMPRWSASTLFYCLTKAPADVDVGVEVATLLGPHSEHGSL